MKKQILTNLQISTSLTIVAALLLTACASNNTVDQSTPATAQPASKSVKLRPEQILATVNGKAIAKSALTQVEKGPESKEVEAKMVDELIARELIAQDFAAKDFSNDPAMMEQLENMQRIMYSQLASEQYIKTLKVSDDELRKLYEQKKSELVSQQFKIRHILLEDQNTANEVIVQLNKGAKFDKLVKKYSKDEGSKAQGGDLGWVDPRAMGPNFAHALSQMKNGEVASQAVQSQYGWHVISREDARTQQAPAFETIKDKLTAAVRMERFQEYIQSLKAKASINKNGASASSADSTK